MADLGRSDEAMLCYRRTLELNPASARAQHNLGSELANRGQLEQALVHFGEAVRLAPEWATARHHLGRALRLSGRDTAALEHLREAVRLDAEHWESRSDLAWILSTDPDSGLSVSAESFEFEGGLDVGCWAIVRFH